MSNDLRPDLHRLVGDFQDALRHIENAWDARDTTEARRRLQEGARRADDCMVRIRALL